MRTKTKTLLLVFIGLFFCAKIMSCSSVHIKPAPEYKGVDPKLQSLVDEYKELAKFQNITFKHEVTMGFTDINNNNIIGLCTYGRGWREIDIDANYYNNATSISKLVLMFHELSHCYCGRDHDYGNGIKYKDASEMQKVITIFDTDMDGFYPDYCPLSLLYPIVVSNICLMRHYGDYIVEMFNRCNPY